jgi:glycosyltransferase involved in cell wall biosynthesis
MGPDGPAVVSVFGVEPLRIGGTETYARELSVQLGQRGWRSALCFVTPPPEDVRRFLEAPNVSIELVGYLHGLNWGAIPPLLQVLRRYKPRIVHFHYSDFLSPYPWLARLVSADQVFVTDHSSRPTGYVVRRASFPKRWLARAVNWPVSTVISVSEYGYRCLTGRGLCQPAKCQMIYNAVDLSRASESTVRGASFRQRFSIPADRTVVVQVSWLIPEKGILDLLAAARLAISRGTNAHFVIVGDGPYREEYKRKAVDLGLADRVTWTGLLEDPFGEGVYDAADIVCQVSRWEEVFGWVIAEAMAYRRPIVATRVGGIPELVTHDVSGFLIERGDVEGLAKRLSILIADPALRSSMGAAGRKVVDEKFDLKTNVARLLETYGIVSRPTSRNTPLV